MRFFIQIDDGDESVNDNAVFINHQSKTFSIGHIGDDIDVLEDHSLSEIESIIQVLQSVQKFVIKEGLISE